MMRRDMFISSRGSSGIVKGSGWRVTGHKGLVCRHCRGIILHHIIAWRARYAVFVRPVVNHGRMSAEIVVRRGSRGGPLESGGFPRIVAGLLAVLHAPEQVEQENELASDGYDCRVRDEFLQRDQIAKIGELGELRVTSRGSGHA